MPRVFQRLTIPGFVCLLGGVAALVGSWINGNALAFLIGYTLIFGISFHWIVARICIQSLEIELIPLSQHNRAYAPFPFEARLLNKSKWLPVSHPKIKIVETGRKREITLKVPYTLSPGQTAKLSFHPQFGRRGKQRLIVVEASVFFPFGITESSKVFSQVSRPVFIWPESIPPPFEIIRDWEYQALKEQDSIPRISSQQLDPHRFRSYLPGDSMRRINWKLSAKTNKLIVTEDPKNAQAQIWFLINTHPSHWHRPVDFEGGIRLLASALEFGFKRGILAGISMNNLRISIRGHLDFKKAMDQISELEMDLSVDAHIPDLEKGEFLIHSGKKGVTIQSPKSRRIAV